MLFLRLCVCVIIFTSFTTSATYAKHKPNIEEHLRKGDQTLNIVDEEEIVIIIGNTGTGKSTLSKFIRKDQSLKIIMNEQLDNIFVDNDDKIGSDDSYTSKTFYPNVDRDPETGIYLIDCAGFSDTRSPEYDLVASYLNKKILESAFRLKIVLVENYSNLRLNNERAGFTNVLKNLARLLGRNIDSFSGAIGLIVCKIESQKTDQQLVLSTETFLNKTKQHLLEKQKVAESDDLEDLEGQIKLASFMIESQNIGLFRRPAEQGQPWELRPLMQNFKSLRQLIFSKLNYSKRTFQEFGVAIAPTTVHYINENLISNATVGLSALFGDWQKREISAITKKADFQSNECEFDFNIDYLKNYAFRLNSIQSMHHLLQFTKSIDLDKNEEEEIKFQASKIMFLFKAIEKNSDIIDEMASDVFGSKKPLLSSIDATQTFVEFLKKLVQDFQLHSITLMAEKSKKTLLNVTLENFDSWRAFLPVAGFTKSTTASAYKVVPTRKMVIVIKEVIEPHLRQLPKYSVNNNVITFIGANVATSQVAAAVGKIGQIHEIAIIASKRVFIDQDLHFTDVHLTIVAPVIEAIGNKLIDLKGGKPLQHQIKKATGHSQNGEKGIDGFSSGSLKILCMDVKNSHLLTLRSIGGDGGDGQHGGDGSAPESLINPDPIPDFGGYYRNLGYQMRIHGFPDYRITYAYSDQIINWNVIFFARNHEWITYNIDFEVKSKKHPSNGGNGGDGGRPADFGKQLTFIFDNNSSVALKNFSKVGSYGKKGNGGVGGKASVVCIASRYRCRGKEKVFRFLFFTFTDEAYFNCYPISNAPCQNGTISGKSGKNGGLPALVESNVRYRYPETFDIFQAIKATLVNFAKSANAYACDTKVSAFLDYVLSENVAATMLKTEHYKELLKVVSGLFLEKSIKAKDLKILIEKLHKSFENFQMNCKNCDKMELVALNFRYASMVENLVALSSGKQIVQLQSATRRMIGKLAENKVSLKDLSVDSFVQQKVNEVLVEINAAGNQIKQLSEKLQSDAKNEADTKFQELLNRVERLRVKQATEELKANERKQEIENGLRANGFGKVFKVMSSLATAFYTPFGAVATFLTSALGSFSNAVMSQMQKLPVFNEILNWKRGPADFFNVEEQDGMGRLLEKAKSLARVFDAENAIGDFIEKAEDTRKAVKIIKGQIRLAQENSGLSNLNSGLKSALANVSDIFDSVRTSLGDKISKLGNDTNLIPLKRDMDDTLKYSSSAGALVEIFAKNNGDKRKMMEIEAAVETNRMTLDGISRFELALYKQFKPMINEMLSMMQRLNNELADQSSVLLQFRKIEVKKYARRFVAMMEKFNREFVDKDDDVGSFLVGLQESMTILIDACEKLNELEAQLQLKKFIGSVQGSECSRTDKAEHCRRLLTLETEIQINEMTRDFLKIFTAYQQSLFPYGGSEIGVLYSTLALLHQSEPALNVEGKSKVLQASLETIHNTLATFEDTVVNDKDKHLVRAEFSSRYISSRPFFKWPRAKFATEIRKLLNGEQVTLVASVLAPGVKNAVKFTSVVLNLTSTDLQVEHELHRELLPHLHLEMKHAGESHFRCGARHYVVGGDSLDFKVSFERTEQGALVSQNNVYDKVVKGNVPLSPYTVWKFRLAPHSNESKRVVLDRLAKFADAVDLELVGAGFYLEEEAPICDTDLGKYYSHFESGM